jgi:hypothetical protein
MAAKPAFKQAFAKGRRCIVPANGFFEWQKIGDHKQPMFITLKSGCAYREFDSTDWSTCQGESDSAGRPWPRLSGPLGAALVSLCWSRAKLHHEILILRHQLNVLRRASLRRVSLTNVDRLLAVWSYRLWPGVLGAVCILRPETIVRWHRQGFRAYWRWRSRLSLP